MNGFTCEIDFTTRGLVDSDGTLADNLSDGVVRILGTQVADIIVEHFMDNPDLGHLRKFFRGDNPFTCTLRVSSDLVPKDGYAVIIPRIHCVCDKSMVTLKSTGE